jgi:hypothetical protein
MFTEIQLSHWLNVVANTVLGCLHPVKRAYFASVPEEHAATTSSASTCKAEMALLHTRARARAHTHTHTKGIVPKNVI